ncbi:MAG: hypothetical protein K2J15_03710, partial [Muribaculaceae bacterium]|nr:hypothetical protein [Muribaculaceae bacterium]
MNKFLLASSMVLAVSAMTMTAQAVFWVPAETQSLNVENNPGGLSSVELTNVSPLKINRACQNYATLEKDGVIVSQIPASNKVAVYTFDGFTKNIDGDLHITFWEDLKTSPYKYTGTYKVTIPDGFFYYEDGTLNEAISGEWGIDNAAFIIEPATGSTLSKLTTITLDFPGADKIEFTSGGYGPDNLPAEGKETRNIFYSYDPLKSEASEDGTAPFESGEIIPEINGTSAVITMPVDYKSGIVTFTFRDGAFKIWYNGNKVPSMTHLTSAKYTIIDNSSSDEANAGYTITPPPGEVYQI